MTDHFIVYPFKRPVTEKFIRARYADAVANDEAEPGYVDIAEIKAALEDSGKVTFADDYDPDDDRVREGLGLGMRGYSGPS